MIHSQLFFGVGGGGQPKIWKAFKIAQQVSEIQTCLVFGHRVPSGLQTLLISDIVQNPDAQSV